MNGSLTLEQRFALQRARYEVSKMSRPALEKTALRLLKSRMEQKNGVQQTLMSNGIMFKIEEQQSGMAEIISEQTHIDFENIRQDTGQVSVFEEMAGWDSELWTDTAAHFDLPDIEDMYDD